MRRPSTLVITGVLLALAASATSWEARGATPSAPTPYEVTATLLNVRAGPGTQHAVLGQVAQGQVYPVLETRGDWARIQLGGAPGRSTWCSLGYLRRTTALIRWVIGDELTVRTGPATRFRALGRLPRGAPLAVVEVTHDPAGEGWARVFYEGTTAWIHARWLGTAPPATAPASAAPTRPRSRAGFIQLAASGPGFESYTGASRRWGHPTLIYGIERAGRRWAPLRRDRIGVGDISLENGGSFPPHAGHRHGREVDVAPVRADGREAPVSVGDPQYSRAWTRRAIDLLRAEVPTDVVLFNDTAIPGVVWYPGHADHFHLRMR